MLREMIINKVKPLSNLIFMPPTHLVLKLNTPGPPLHIQQQHQAAPQPQQQQQSHHQRHQLQCDHHFQAGSLPWSLESWDLNLYFSYFLVLSNHTTCRNTRCLNKYFCQTSFWLILSSTRRGEGGKTPALYFEAKSLLEETTRWFCQKVVNSI